MVGRNFRWICTALAVAAMALAILPAQAEPFCSEHDDLAAWLVETYHEQRVGYGLAGDTAIVEVFASTRGTWTMLMTGVDGQSCIVAAGEGWENEFATLGQGA